MASLTGQNIKDTYQSLLKTDDNGLITNAFKGVTDGSGNASGLYLKDDGVEVNGSLVISGSLLYSGSTIDATVTSASYALTASYAMNGGGSVDTGSFATTGSNTFTGTQIITGNNGVLKYSGNAGVNYPTLAEIRANDAYPWLERFYNDTFSTSSAVMAYFAWNDGRFIFHNESTESIGLQVNGYAAENGLLVYEDKVAFVNNIEVSGSIYLGSGSIISESGSTLVLSPPTALPGQSLVIRPTAPSLTSNHPSGFYSGDSITIVFAPSGGTVTGTGSYVFTGCTEVQLGTPLTGSLLFNNEVTQSLTWTVPAISDITGFTFDIYNFATFVTNSISLSSSGSSEHSHVHLISSNPATTDLYLGDDDQYIKIEKNAGNVVIGTNLDTYHWVFNTSGSSTVPGNITFPSGSFISSTNESGSIFISTLNNGILHLNEDGGEGDILMLNGQGTKVYIDGRLEQGLSTIASGSYSHAEGIGTQAIGDYSHAEGGYTQAIGEYSHAEGYQSISSGSYSHAEGFATQAVGYVSHAEGQETIASGDFAHAEGGYTQAVGDYSHAEGQNTQAIGNNSHAEGQNTQAIGNNSHAEGQSTKTGTQNAYYAESVASGVITLSGSYGDVSSQFGADNRLYLYDTPFDDSYGRATFIISQSYFDSTNTIIELYEISVGTTTAYVGDLGQGISNWAGDQTIPGTYSHAEGSSTQAIGLYTHAEGVSTQAIGDYSHAEGEAGQAIGGASHAEGYQTQAIGPYSHAEGSYTQAVGDNSHAEGANTEAVGNNSHAEGETTQAIGDYSHAEGTNTQAVGYASHAEGASTQAIGLVSHAEGYQTIASGSYQHASGQYNQHNNTESYFIVGIGLNDGARKDGFTVDVDANGSGSVMIPNNVSTPSVAKTGSMYVDPTNNKLWIYTGNGGVSGWVTSSLG